MAHTKSSGATRLGRDSGPQYLGVKKYDGERVQPGNIIVRQRGSTILPGANVRQGKDYTLYAVAVGTVKFSERRKTRFDGTLRRVKVVNVLQGIGF
ncbi:MAG: 50S ribosomal protein L27 [Candidatus Sungbacteria bacterium RIFCSPLOWO2_01_FULL_59_16]|uniref:Large ribosomal subunit protein bL27 n=1 Tax=Candidatus Sungbacteria bacterium RIFCSPLOWO2_01_FULL_59_16 TaxID=1802280 RepID=A0A1G2LCL3_9BACT|nr:MAG: 50S ribosomal protein L27 [Candidatus Sungbacteria bacterium RIFCSPLOWO2_01_FULL_59_16]